MVDSPGKLSSLAAPSKLVSRLPHTQEGRGIQEPEEEPQTVSLGSCVSGTRRPGRLCCPWLTDDPEARAVSAGKPSSLDSDADGSCGLCMGWKRISRHEAEGEENKVY